MVGNACRRGDTGLGRTACLPGSPWRDRSTGRSGRRGLFESASTAPYDDRGAAWQSGARHARPFRMRGACCPNRQADSAMAHRYVRSHRSAETSFLFPRAAHAPCDVNKPRRTTEIGAFIHGVNVATAQCNGSFPLINSHIVTCWALTSCHCFVMVDEVVGYMQCLLASLK